MTKEPIMKIEYRGRSLRFNEDQVDALKSLITTGWFELYETKGGRLQEKIVYNLLFELIEGRGP